MKLSFCSVVAAGVLIRDPKIIDGYTNSVGLSGTIVIEKYFTDMDGTPKKSTNYMDFMYWCNPETVTSLNLKKSDFINVEGEIIQKSWEEDGKRRHRHELKLKSLRKL
jgi:single-stranded DNA-binding protein